MTTIEERATLDADKFVGKEGNFGAWQSHRLAYIRVATEQREIDIEKAKKAFCEARCPLQYEMCQKENWQKGCLAYFNFCRAMEE